MSARREPREANIDALYSSGDSNMPRTSQAQARGGKRRPEENNNEVDELGQELQMGCVVGAVKRPPNICVETCVYDGSETDQDSNNSEEDDAYSEEFEDECEAEEPAGSEPPRLEPKLAKSATPLPSARARPPSSTLKLSKSHSFMSSKMNKSVSGRTNYGALSIPATRRVNMSFTNERLREIERTNHILLKKIITARDKRTSSIPPPALEPPLMKRHVPNAAVHRRKLQRRIDHENMILLRKIQAAKSSACSLRR